MYMRIAQISTLCTPVRQRHSGSVEFLVWLITRELIRMGHEVTVFAAGGSETHGELVSTLPGAYGKAGSPADWIGCELLNLCRAVEQSSRFDLLHSHNYLYGLPMQMLTKVPIVNTTHVMPGKEMADMLSFIPGARVTAISDFQWSAFPEVRPVARIHHGIDPTEFTFRSSPDNYLCFLGRFNPGKGALTAIETARALGIPLILAGPKNRYYQNHIEGLVDGQFIKYAGYVTGTAKGELLGGALALLYPIQLPEPFGLVLIESMMCGTPVVATPIGAVPEIVSEGVTGYSSSSKDGFVEATIKAIDLDRRGVRKQADANFSAQRMAREYADLYRQIISGLAL